MEEGLKLTGSFNMQVIDAATGNVLEHYANPNLVVTVGKTNTAKILGGDAAGHAITQIAFGDNNTAPAVTDTALSNVFAKAFDSVSYPTANSVQFNWTLLNSEANGLTIRELGLLTSVGVLSARKVRSDIVKTSAIKLVGSWQLFIN